MSIVNFIHREHLNITKGDFLAFKYTLKGELVFVHLLHILSNRKQQTDAKREKKV